MTKPSKLLFTTFVILSATADPILAQSATDRSDAEECAIDMRRHHVRLDQLIGKSVELEPSAEAKLEAAQENDATPEGPSADLADVIIDLRSGEMTWAVMSVGGLLGIGDRTVAVPFDRVIVRRPADTDASAEDVALEFPCTEAKLEKLPVFDEDEASDDGIIAAVKVCEATWAASFGDAPKTPEDDATDADSDREGVIVGATTVVSRPFAVAVGSSLQGEAVYATDGEFGSIDRVVVDPKSGHVQWVVVSRGGVLGVGDSLHLVPFAALRMQERDESWAWCLPKTVDQLQKCESMSDEELVVVSREDAERSCKFFGVTPRDQDSNN